MRYEYRLSYSGFAFYDTANAYTQILQTYRAKPYECPRPLAALPESVSTVHKPARATFGGCGRDRNSRFSNSEPLVTVPCVSRPSGSGPFEAVKSVASCVGPQESGRASGAQCGGCVQHEGIAPRRSVPLIVLTQWRISALSQEELSIGSYFRRRKTQTSTRSSVSMHVCRLRIIVLRRRISKRF